MTSILYEIFPVTLVSKQVALIQHDREENFTPWIIQNLPNIHPNEIVVNHLTNIFVDIFDRDQMIVHSTSWRYENKDDHVILTSVSYTHLTLPTILRV